MIYTMRSHVQSMVTDTQKNVVLLLFESILIRDGLALLPRWFLKYGVQTIVRPSCLCSTL